MLFLKWRTCGCFLLVWVNCPSISKGNLEKNPCILILEATISQQKWKWHSG